MAERQKHYPTFVDGRYAHTSPSQIKNFLQCSRIWYSEKFVSLRKPTTEAMLRGTGIHSGIEDYLLYNEITGEWTDYVLAAKEHLDSLLDGSTYTIEREIYRDTFPGGPKLVGYKDLEIKKHGSLTILDYKSTSDRKYAKTPLELAEDLQLNAYAQEAFEENEALETVRLGHLYLLTKNKKKAAWPVWADVTRTEAAAVWAKTLGYIREMTQIAEWHFSQTPVEDRFEALKPNTDSCGMYGGCYFRSRCGIGSEKVNFSVDSLLRKKPGAQMPSLSEKLAAKKLQSAPANAEPIPAVQTVIGIVKRDIPLSILPPDAPPQDEVPPEEVIDEKPKKAKAKKTEKLNLDDFKTPTVATEVVKPVTPAALVRKKLVILEGCIPLKGEFKSYTLFEDWISPLMKSVADDHGVADYRLIQYTSKAALATKIRESLDTVPEVLVIGGYAAGASEAMEVLVPHATVVIKSLK